MLDEVQVSRDRISLGSDHRFLLSPIKSNRPHLIKSRPMYIADQFFFDDQFCRRDPPGKHAFAVLGRGLLCGRRPFERPFTRLSPDRGRFMCGQGLAEIARCDGRRERKVRVGCKGKRYRIVQSKRIFPPCDFPQSRCDQCLVQNDALARNDHRRTDGSSR